MGSYDRKNLHMDIETYDMLILLLKTCKMRYYMTLNSKIGILPILGITHFQGGQKKRLGDKKKIGPQIFCIFGTLKDHKNQKIENEHKKLARIHLDMHPTV